MYLYIYISTYIYKIMYSTFSNCRPFRKQVMIMKRQVLIQRMAAPRARMMCH